jgi:5'-phosphate synthase pdxT subunit
VKAGVLALQGAFREHAEVLDALGAEPVDVRVPGDLGGLDAIFLPGGESTTVGRLLGTSGLLEPLRAALADGLPAFGTCAGLILLATDVSDGRPDQPVLGAIDVGVRRNAYGRQRESFEADLEIDGLDGGPFRGVFIRAPMIERVGPGVEVLARDDESPVLCRQGKVWVSTFHPELSDDLRLHQRFLTEVGQVEGDRVEGNER